MDKETTTSRLNAGEEFWQDGIKYEVLDDAMSVTAKAVDEEITKAMVPGEVIYRGSPYTVEEVQLSDCPFLTSLEIPEGAADVKIEDCPALECLCVGDEMSELKVFRCTALRSLRLVEGIGYIDLSGCTALREVNIHNGAAFVNLSGCTSLERAELPERVGWLYLAGCTSLLNVNFPENLRGLYLEGVSKSIFGKPDEPATALDLSRCVNLERLCLSYDKEMDGRNVILPECNVEIEIRSASTPEDQDGLRFLHTASEEEETAE